MNDHLVFILESILYPVCLIFAICYPIPWLMHLCAIINAKIKLNRTVQLSKTNLIDQSLRLWTHKILNCFGRKKQQPQASPIPVSPTSEQIDNMAILTKETPYQPYQQQISPACAVLPPWSNLPGVSIIKPIVGIDTNLEKNLETFFRLDYPTFELLFCVQDPGDDAIALVENLINRYPSIDAKLFVGGLKVGVNPKINNMQPAYEASKYEFILISDSGISMKKDTLLEMALDMRCNVALIHQMPFVLDGHQGFRSVVEKVFFGTAHARAYLTADLIGINCPTGMSALMRKHLLDEVGGIKAFGKYLAEDFFFAKSFTDRGWEISIGRQPAWQNSSNADDDLSIFTNRIERWIKLRFAMVPHWTLLEPLSECMLLGFLESLVYYYLWSFNPYTFFLAHVISWYILDYKLLRIIQNGPLEISLYKFTQGWLVRECTALLIFIKALSNPLVVWRSKVFRLRWGGYAEEVYLEKPTTTPSHINPTPTGSKHNDHDIIIVEYHLSELKSFYVGSDSR